jgi:hypothetical protein
MNIIAAIVFISLGIAVTYAGKNDPPEPLLVKMFVVTLFIVCPATYLLSATTFLRSTISWMTPVATALNWAMCAFGFLFGLIAVFGKGYNFAMLLGVLILFFPFAVNIHALSEHRLDPSSQQTAGYKKKK